MAAWKPSCVIGFWDLRCHPWLTDLTCVCSPHCLFTYPFIHSIIDSFKTFWHFYFKYPAKPITHQLFFPFFTAWLLASLQLLQLLPQHLLTSRLSARPNRTSRSPGNHLPRMRTSRATRWPTAGVTWTQRPYTSRTQPRRWVVQPNQHTVSYWWLGCST